MFFRLMSFLILAALVGLPADAAEPLVRPYWHTPLVHKSWARRDGAPTAVFGITQDQHGMLWFAASDGVYRFDGVRFDRLNEIDGNKLRSPNTNAVLAVGSALWIGYNFDGVSVFDKGKVRHYGPEQGLPIGTVYKIARTQDGVMWLSKGSGLYWLDGGQWRVVTPADGLPTGDIHYFNELPDGSIVANHLDGIYRSKSGTHQFHKQAGGRGIEIHQTLTNGDALLVNSGRQFFRYSVLANTSKPVVFPPDVKAVDPFLDERGALWVNTDAGLKLLDRDAHTLHVFDGVSSISGKQVFNSFDDREGNLWLTTENGIDLIRESRLNTVPLPPRMFRGLSVQAGADGTVWVGNRKTDGNYDTSTFGQRPDGSRVTAPMHDVVASLTAPDGSVWCGSPDALWHFDHGRWQEWPFPASLRGNDVQSMAIDRAGRLWVAIHHRGVLTFQDGQWVAGGGIPALAQRAPISLHADAADRIWFGYPLNHIAVLDHDILREYGPQDGIEIGNVSVMTSYHGRLLAGGDQGVAVLTGQRFSTMQDAAGQPLKGVAAMVVTSAGELWLHGADGLARVTAADLQGGLNAGSRVRVDRFDYLDGYEGKPSQIRPLAVLTEAADGRIWYASSIQVGWIDPANIERNALAPVPKVTALRTDNGTYAPGPGLVLPKDTRNLDLAFTAATLGIPERARFRYRLDGLETAWRDAGGLRSASYSNLGPGDYRFEVVAANEDGVWSSVPATQPLRITPAFVQTMWFKLLCALLALALVSLLYWRRLAVVTARVTERLRERLRERERIARTLHDNFLQSVQALMMQFDLVKHSLPNGDPMQTQIDAALCTAADVLAEGREQVLALRLNHALSGDLEPALSGLGHILGPRHGARFALAVKGTPRTLRSDCAAEAFAIGREAMLNAFRHGHSEVVILTLHYSPTHFVLNVRDHGCGMDASIHASGHRPGHFGLQGMRERAADVGGTLEISSADGEGTAVTLRIPTRNAYVRAVRKALQATAT